MMRIAIAGAGIAGMTTALALAADGVAVDLFDGAEALSEAGAGLQLSPNATRILRDLKLLDTLDAAALRPECVLIRRAGDGATLAALPLGANAERRFGAPFLVVHRADLQAVLLAAVRAEPQIALTLGRRLEGFEMAAGGVRLTVAGTGMERQRQADALIGADGLHSRVRAALAAPAADPLRFSGRIAWRSLVPAADAPEYARQAASNLWLGRGAHLVHYPVRGGALVNGVAITSSAWPQGVDIRSWTVAGDRARLKAAFAGWCGQARVLLDAAPDWRVWPLFDRKPLARWAEGPVMLAGDAAHPMLPFLAQGSAQAIEDAAAIAAALRTAATPQEAGRAYERARMPKAERVQRESRRQGSIYHLGPPASLARDAAFALLGPDRMLARYDWLYGIRRKADS